jgi:hypothetical protein
VSIQGCPAKNHHVGLPPEDRRHFRVPAVHLAWDSCPGIGAAFMPLCPDRRRRTSIAILPRIEARFGRNAAPHCFRHKKTLFLLVFWRVLHLAPYLTVVLILRSFLGTVLSRVGASASVQPAVN